MKKILVLTWLLAQVFASPLASKEDGVLHRAAQRLHEANQRLAAKTSLALANAKTNIHNTNENIATKTSLALGNAKTNIRNFNENVATKTSETLEYAKNNIHNANENMVIKASEAIENVKTNIETFNITEVVEKSRVDIRNKNKKFHDKVEKIRTGEEPLVDVKVNGHIKILNSEIAVHNEMKIGGHQTGFSGSVNAKVLGQKANAHIDILNIHKPKPQPLSQNKKIINYELPRNTVNKLQQQQRPLQSYGKNTVNYQQQLVQSGTNGRNAIEYENPTWPGMIGGRAVTFQQPGGNVILYT